MWNIAIQPAVSCYNSWANLRCSGCYPLGEKLLWNRSIQQCLVTHVCPRELGDHCLASIHSLCKGWLIVNWSFMVTCIWYIKNGRFETIITFWWYFDLWHGLKKKLGHVFFLVSLWTHSGVEYLSVNHVLMYLITCILYWNPIASHTLQPNVVSLIPRDADKDLHQAVSFHSPGHADWRKTTWHNDVIKGRYWPFVRGIHLSPLTKSQKCRLWCSLDVGPYKLLNKQSKDRRFEITCSSCDIVAMNIFDNQGSIWFTSILAWIRIYFNYKVSWNYLSIPKLQRCSV